MWNITTLKSKINPRTANLIVITVLVAAVIILAGQCYIFWKDSQAQKSLNQTYQYNEKILGFTKLFITKEKLPEEPQVVVLSKS